MFAPPQRYRSDYNDNYDNGRYGNGYGNNNEDPLKKLVLLNGVTSGTVDPLAAVVMDKNKGLSGTDTILMSSLGNSGSSDTATMLALSGGLGGGRGGGGSSVASTLLMANALAPKKDGESSSSGNSALNTLAMASMFSNNGNGNGLFGGNNGGW